MGRTGKVIVFIIVCFVILLVLTILKESGAGAVMWLGALAIPLIYKSMFGKKEQSQNENSTDITLNKKKNEENDDNITLNKQ